MHLQLNLSVSHHRWSASSCSPKTLETRWQRSEERLQELTQNLIDTCRRRLTLWLTMFCCSGRNENTPTHSWHQWQRISSQHLPLKHMLRVFSVCVDLCCRKRNRATKCLERRVFLKMNRKLVSAYLWTDMWTCACVNLACHNWWIGLFDCLWIYRCCWSWLAFTMIPITTCVTLTVTLKNN